MCRFGRIYNGPGLKIQGFRGFGVFWGLGVYLRFGVLGPFGVWVWGVGVLGFGFGRVEILGFARPITQGLKFRV